MTNVISELWKPKPHASVVEWIYKVNDSALFLFAVTAREIQSGIETTKDQDPLKANQIESGLDQWINNFNILCVDNLAFRIWGKLISKKSYAVNEDAVIAAIAISNHLTTVTRNAEDFQRFKVSPTNPFK